MTVVLSVETILGNQIHTIRSTKITRTEHKQRRQGAVRYSEIQRRKETQQNKK